MTHLSLALTILCLVSHALVPSRATATSSESPESSQPDTGEYRVQLTQGDTLEFDLHCKVKGPQPPNAPLDGTVYFELHRKDVFPFEWINSNKVFVDIRGPFPDPKLVNPIFFENNPRDFICRIVTPTGESILGVAPEEGFGSCFANSPCHPIPCPTCMLYRKGALVLQADFEVLNNARNLSTAWVTVSNPDWRYIPDSAFLTSEPQKGGSINGKQHIGRIITPNKGHLVLSVPESVPEEEVESPFAFEVKYPSESVNQVLVPTVSSQIEKVKLATLVCEKASGPLILESFTEEVTLGVKMVTETGEQVTGFVEGLNQQIFKKVG